MALQRRPRAGDVIRFKPNPHSRQNEHIVTVGFATDDGLARNESGVAIFIWGFGADRSELNKNGEIIEEGPDVPDPRSSQDLLHDGKPCPPIRVDANTAWTGWPTTRTDRGLL